MKKFYLAFLFILPLMVFSQSPTWSGDVAKIMYGNCTSCHRTGGMAPFSLTTYDDVSPMAAWLDQNIQSTNMPPWPADEDYKSFVHQRVLSQADKQTFSDWVAAGTPSGDLRFAPPIPTYSNGSQLGTPNLILQTGNFTVTQSGDQYRNFVIPTGVSQLNYATAVEVIPGNSEIVHHALVFIDTNTTVVDPNSLNAGLNSELIYSYVPGAVPYYSPVGMGFRIPPNARIILQVHYAPGSQGLIDNTVINFKLTTQTQRRIRVSAALNHINTMVNGPLSIPANEVKTFNESLLINTNLTVLYAFPHMHLIGKSIRSWANLPLTNDTVRFVNIPDWDFNWQDNYVFPNAIKIPTGSTLKATAVYDNTGSNPNQPSSPPINVGAGEGTFDEMMIVFFAYTPYLNGDENTIIDKRIIPMGATTFCEGQSVRLKTIEGVGYTYQWKLNGTNISGATNYYHEATQSGNYTVLIALGSNSATSDPVAITVNPKPIATINQPANYSVPQTLVGTNCGSCTYQWYLNDSPINGATTSNYAVTQAGIYYLEIYNGCYAISDTVILGGAIPFMISVSANPTIGGSVSGGGSFVLGTNATVTAVPNNGYSFVNWTENGTVVSSQNPYSFTVNQNRNLVANFDLLSDVEEINQPFTIFPNPSEGVFSMSTVFDFTYKIVTVGGKLVAQNEGFKKEHSIHLNSPGIYYIQIENRQGHQRFEKVLIK
jgi:hypothetical protein